MVMQNRLWTVSYTHLLKTDDEGNQYSYRVEEKSAESKIEGDQYKVSQNKYDLINTLTGTVEIPVTKIWKDRDDKSVSYTHLDVYKRQGYRR